jgi:phosphoglycerate dehydrogenase-like enzyme
LLQSVDLLIVEPLAAEVTGWLRGRHAVHEAPELASDAPALREALADVRALIVPAQVRVDARMLRCGPRLRAIGRISGGAENVDLDACTRVGVEIVRSLTATAHAEAEFMLGALLSMLRRVAVTGADGVPVGRELGAATVGLIGLAPAARAMVRMLGGFGSQIVGYDPSVHSSDAVWGRWRVRPMGLRELLERSDAVCVQLDFFSRYQGLLGPRFLDHCKPEQVLVSVGHSGLFDEVALARALRSGRLAAAWFDSLEPGALDAGRPLCGIDTLQVTPRVASTTRESRLRSAWEVAKRIDHLLAEGAEADARFTVTVPGGLTGLAAGPTPR